jgi:hypothetical protein
MLLFKYLKTNSWTVRWLSLDPSPVHPASVLFNSYFGVGDVFNVCRGPKTFSCGTRPRPDSLHHAVFVDVFPPHADLTTQNKFPLFVGVDILERIAIVEQVPVASAVQNGQVPARRVQSVFPGVGHLQDALFTKTPRSQTNYLF